jgi:hypothetical protein
MSLNFEHNSNLFLVTDKKCVNFILTNSCMLIRFLG